MSQAKSGDRVSIRFTAKTSKGAELASSPEGEYIEVALGQEELIPAIENQIIGMTVGETKSFSITEEEGFPYDDQLVFPIEKEHLPEDRDPTVGDQLALQSGDGRTLPATIIEIQETQIVLDANPPFAGCSMDVELELSKIES